MTLYLFRKSFFPSDRVWLNMTLGISKLLLKPQKLLLKKRGCVWYRLHEYPLSSSFFLELGYAILNQYFFIRYAHFTWHSNTPLLTSSKLDLETACYCWVRTFSTTILRFTGYGYFQFVHINFAMNKETINQPAKAKRIYKNRNIIMKEIKRCTNYNI